MCSPLSRPCSVLSACAAQLQGQQCGCCSLFSPTRFSLFLIKAGTQTFRHKLIYILVYPSTSSRRSSRVCRWAWLVQTQWIAGGVAAFLILARMSAHCDLSIYISVSCGLGLRGGGLYLIEMSFESSFIAFEKYIPKFFTYNCNKQRFINVSRGWNQKNDHQQVGRMRLILVWFIFKTQDFLFLLFFEITTIPHHVSL